MRKRTKVPAGFTKIRFTHQIFGTTPTLCFNDDDLANCPRPMRDWRDFNGNPIQYPESNSIYLLVRKKQVIYIGITGTLEQRVTRHYNTGKSFDAVYVYCRFPKWRGKETERWLISAFRPPLNVRWNPDKDYQEHTYTNLKKLALNPT